MRLKYYLRGLGLGIIFAVIIMMIGFHDNKQSMSDTEIIEKAKTPAQSIRTAFIPFGPSSQVLQSPCGK